MNSTGALYAERVRWSSEAGSRDAVLDPAGSTSGASGSYPFTCANMATGGPPPPLPGRSENGYRACKALAVSRKSTSIQDRPYPYRHPTYQGRRPSYDPEVM